MFFVFCFFFPEKICTSNNANLRYFLQKKKSTSPPKRWNSWIPKDTRSTVEAGRGEHLWLQAPLLLLFFFPGARHLRAGKRKEKKKALQVPYRWNSLSIWPRQVFNQKYSKKKTKHTHIFFLSRRPIRVGSRSPRHPEQNVLAWLVLIGQGCGRDVPQIFTIILARVTLYLTRTKPGPAVLLVQRS